MLMHSSQMGRAGPETGMDVPKDTQQIRLDQGLERTRGNAGGNPRNREMDK